MVWWLAVTIGCGAPAPAGGEAHPLPVAEAYDVPPPPGQRTLDLGPVAASRVEGVALGGALRITGSSGVLAERAEVVDLRSDEVGTTVTVYLDEVAAERVLGTPGPKAISALR